MNRLHRLPGMLPYLAGMFLNAFVDLGHKIVVQNTLFKVYDGTLQVVLTAILNALILLPFILLFVPAGYCSDRFAKHRVMRAAAWLALVLTSLITLCYYQGWFWWAFGLTLLMGVQSAIYSPAKYGYLKPLVGNERLTRGNGAVQAVTITAILGGTLAFSVLFEARFDRLGGASKAAILQAIAPLGWLLVLSTLVELLCTYRLPAVEHGAGRQLPARDVWRPQAVRDTLAPLRNRPAIWMPVIGLATFWSVSQVVLAVFPAFAKASLGITNTVLLQGMIASTGIGILLGSLLAGRWSRRHIETGLVPLGGAGLVLGLCLLPTLDAVWLHCANFVLLGVAGGLFIVPLNALMQYHAGEHELGKVIAGNNLFQNIAMLLFLIVTAMAAQAGIDTLMLLLLVAVTAAIGVGYTVYRLPQSLLRPLLWLGGVRRLEVTGLAQLPESGPLRLVTTGGWRAWAVLQAATPRRLRLAAPAALPGNTLFAALYRRLGQEIALVHEEAGAALARTWVSQGEVVLLLGSGNAGDVAEEGAVAVAIADRAGAVCVNFGAATGAGRDAGEAVAPRFAAAVAAPSAPSPPADSSTADARPGRDAD